MYALFGLAGTTLPIITVSGQQVGVGPVDKIYHRVVGQVVRQSETVDQSLRANYRPARPCERRTTLSRANTK